MKALLVLHCIIWAKGDFTTLVDQPVSEYGMASVSLDKMGFSFSADVIEEKMNSMQIEFKEKEVKTLLSSFDDPQNSFYTKLEVGSSEASMTCEIKKN